MRPRKNGETLKAYADDAADRLQRLAGKAFNTQGIDAVWPVIFRAIRVEGQFVREVSPAAIMIYQRYLAIAVAYLYEYPDKKNRKELIVRVTNDLKSNNSKTSRMDMSKHFTTEERAEGSMAFRIIRKSLLSMA